MFHRRQIERHVRLEKQSCQQQMFAASTVVGRKGGGGVKGGRGVVILRSLNILNF